MKIQNEIQKLKIKDDVVFLAHYYTRPEIQEIADYVGDSFYLSKIASTLPNQTLVFCGVSFMGESTKLLSPHKTILMPDITADCPMAHMCTKEIIAKVKSENQDVAVVCYINSTADLKAYSDVCVTSANAYKVVNALPNKNIFFIPDKNLGHYLADCMPQKNFIFNNGFCPIHEKITALSIENLKQKYSNAKVLSHPECNNEVLTISDFIGSTSQIIQFATNDSCNEYIICTENGVRYELEKQNSNKNFYFPLPEPICPGMKKITLEKVLTVLKNKKNEVIMSNEHICKSKPSLDKMMALSR